MNVCGVGSNVVDEGYEGPCSVILRPRGADMKVPINPSPEQPR